MRVNYLELGLVKKKKQPYNYLTCCINCNNINTCLNNHVLNITILMQNLFFIFINYINKYDIIIDICIMKFLKL